MIFFSQCLLWKGLDNFLVVLEHTIFFKVHRPKELA